jgi:hypothetical protein
VVGALERTQAGVVAMKNESIYIPIGAVHRLANT